MLRYVFNGAIYLCRLPILVISEVFFQSCTALYSNPFPDVEESKDDDVLLFQLLPKFHGRRYVSNKNPFFYQSMLPLFVLAFIYQRTQRVLSLSEETAKKQVRLRKGVKNTQVFFKTESYVFFWALPPSLNGQSAKFFATNWSKKGLN